MSIAAFILCVTPVATDGDSFRCNNITGAIRVAGIDAPDKTCPKRRRKNCSLYGPRGDWKPSHEAFQIWLDKGRVMVSLNGTDPYKRHIGVICSNKVNVNAWMVKERYAKHKEEWNGWATKVDCPK